MHLNQRDPRECELYI